MAINKCLFCDLIDKFRTYGYWIHCGFGNREYEKIEYSELYFNNEIIKSDYFDKCDILKDLPKLDIIFDLNHRNYSQVVTRKPKNVVWFSPGDWIRIKNQHICKNNEFNNMKIFMIKNPKNILKISTLEELDVFCKKYIPEFTSSNHDRDYYVYKNIPDWDLVKKSDYAGIEFNFAKTTDIGASYIEYLTKYNWHITFDCISLCVWDFDMAFNNSVVPCIITL
jgi:hypothetical protein